MTTWTDRLMAEAMERRLEEQRHTPRAYRPLTCGAPGCTAPAVNRGMCNTHHHRHARRAKRLAAIARDA